MQASLVRGLSDGSSQDLEREIIANVLATRRVVFVETNGAMSTEEFGGSCAAELGRLRVRFVSLHGSDLEPLHIRQALDTPFGTGSVAGETVVVVDRGERLSASALSYLWLLCQASESGSSPQLRLIIIGRPTVQHPSLTGLRRAAGPPVTLQPTQAVLSGAPRITTRQSRRATETLGAGGLHESTLADSLPSSITPFRRPATSPAYAVPARSHTAMLAISAGLLITVAASLLISPLFLDRVIYHGSEEPAGPPKRDPVPGNAAVAEDVAAPHSDTPNPAPPPTAPDPAATEVTQASGSAELEPPDTPIAGRPLPSGLIAGVANDMPVSVTVSVWPGDAQAGTNAARLVAWLRQQGISAITGVPTNKTDHATDIRYFFEHDAVAAEIVAQALSDVTGEQRSTKLIRSDPLPAPGTIELTVTSR